MKLSLKIFLGISIPSFIAILFISSILINKSFNTNLNDKLDLYMQDLSTIDLNIKKNINENMDYVEVVGYMGDYYKDKNKYLLLYKKNDLVYTNNYNFIINNNELFNLDNNKYNVLIKKEDNNHYAFIAQILDDDYYLIYIRELNSVYEERNNLIRVCALVVTITIVVIILIAFIISKTLTKPLLNIKKEMNKLSTGNYNINLKEGTDEIGILARDFNIMSKELEKRNNDLLDMIDSKQLFIDNLSHEMNTPLTSIYGYSILLENAMLSEEQKIKYLKYIQDETDRISQMYKKILSISYKENTNIEIKEISLNDLFNGLYIELKNKLESKNINLVIENNIDKLFCDQMLVSVAISNLVRNAIAVSNDNSKIIIKTYIENNKKYISVQDEGPGIESEQIEKIVEPFYRIDKARSRKNGGAGLGLSIVSRIMELHKGKLIIKSKINEGSNFILEFN